MLAEKECYHIAEVLEETKKALSRKDALSLKALSNKTIHSACNEQDSASITIAVIIYTLAKLVEREDYKKVRSWETFAKKINSVFDLAIKALNENNQEAYQNYIQKARLVLESNSVNLKPYIQDVLKKAAINKGSKLYEHGISLEQTSKILGVSRWELSDYIGQKSLQEIRTARPIDVKRRAKLAMEFFS